MPSPTATLTNADVPPTSEVAALLEGSPTATLNPVEPIIATDLEAPIRITLPEGWMVGRTVLSDGAISEEFSTALWMQEGLLEELPFLPFTIYRGDVTGGTGYIVVIWAFRNITTSSPGMERLAQIDLQGDGIRLLNLAVLEPGCVVGYDVDREFMVGNQLAAGTYFAAEDCPAPDIGEPRAPNVKGWFAVTQQEGINFAFYVYTEPAEAMDGEALNELQAIMDTVVFDMSLLPQPVPTATPTAAGSPDAMPSTEEAPTTQEAQP
jgi:hypothetical protein